MLVFRHCLNSSQQNAFSQSSHISCHSRLPWLAVSSSQNNAALVIYNALKSHPFKLQLTWPKQIGKITSIAFSPYFYLVAGTDAGELFLFNLQSTAKVAQDSSSNIICAETILDYTSDIGLNIFGSITKLTFDNSGRYIALTSSQGGAWVVDTILKSLNPLTTALNVYDIAFSPSGAFLALATDRGIVVTAVSKAMSLHISPFAKFKSTARRISWGSPRILLFPETSSLGVLIVTPSTITGGMPLLAYSSNAVPCAKAIGLFAVDPTGERLLLSFKDSREMSLLTIKMDAGVNPPLYVVKTNTLMLQEDEDNSVLQNLQFAGSWFNSGALAASAYLDNDKGITTIRFLPCSFISENQVAKESWL